jgi:acetyltransferase-like isoleucine patch superfamily enzyme
MRKILIVLAEPYRLLSKLRIVLERLLSVFPAFRFFRKTRKDEYPITLPIWYRQRFLGKNAGAYWPMHPSSSVSYPKNILIGKGVCPGYMPGCYFHGLNGIIIGDYSFIAPNVGIMSANHDIHDLRKQTSQSPVVIGKYCWLGMNAMILPGVELGDFTIVGAGAIVTTSFKEGHCVIAGNPAKVIRKLDSSDCLRYEQDFSYIGYVPVSRFESFRKRYLTI